MHLNQFNHPKIPRGFTMVELMMTLIIAVILTGLAVPGFGNFIQQMRLSAAVGELRNAMNLARTEAIKRNGKVDLIAIDGNWVNGWVIRSADNDQILTHERLHKEFKLSGKFTDGEQHIAYNGTGHTRTKNSSAASQSGHIQVTLGDNSRLIVVNFLGRVRICNPATDKNCTTDLAD
jgi:type IV fimbrial biogenesis protein FimT